MTNLLSNEKKLEDILFFKLTTTSSGNLLVFVLHKQFNEYTIRNR